MDSQPKNVEKDPELVDKFSKAMTDGGVAVARTTGKVVGYSGKLLRMIKDTGTGFSLPSLPVKGLFSGGVLKRWGGEKANIKVSIAKTRQKIENLYNDIGKRGAGLSGVEDITKHESVKKLIDEVKSCENQIKSWEKRLTEIDKERAEERSKKLYESSGKQKSGADEAIKKQVRTAIDGSIKTASFKNSSEKAIFDKVTHDLMDDDIEIRLLAAAELGKSANVASIPVLKEALGYGNVYLASEIINAMININDPSCLPVFKGKANDDNYRIRLGSLRGIYKLSGEDSVPYLIDGLKDKHAEVRKSSATFLGWVGVKDAAPALIQSLKDSDQEVKKAAAMSLAILRDTSSVMPLIRTLGETSIEGREKIVHAIERITGKSVEFKIDASGEALRNNIENLKNWWQKNKMADVEGVLEEAAPKAKEAAPKVKEVKPEAKKDKPEVKEAKPAVKEVKPEFKKKGKGKNPQRNR